jgi:hypothetical protein
VTSKNTSGDEVENMNSQFEEFSGILPPELMRRAYRIRNELAWARDDAIEAIDRLEKAGFTLLGVEVWIPSSPGPKMTGRDWDSEDRAAPDVPATARDFVKNFKWGPYDATLKGDEPFFNLTVAEKRN